MVPDPVLDPYDFAYKLRTLPRPCLLHVPIDAIELVRTVIGCRHHQMMMMTISEAQTTLTPMKVLQQIVQETMIKPTLDKLCLWLRWPKGAVQGQAWKAAGQCRCLKQ